MAEQPEVIQKELEETRHALAEKLEQISTKISGTVETVTDTVTNVTDTVANMTETVEDTVQSVADSVSGTVESVKDTVSSMGETASETVEAVRQAFNLPEHIRQYPWAWVGGSVVLGFIGGKIFAPRSSHTAESTAFAQGSGYQPKPAEAPSPAVSASNGKSYLGSTTSDSGSTSNSWLSGIMEHFGTEIDKLKGLALGTLFGVTRDMVSKSLPESLKDQVSNLFNEFTEKVGGEPIKQHILDDADQDASKGNDHEHGDTYTTGMDRPVGATGGKSKAGVGYSDRR